MASRWIALPIAAFLWSEKDKIAVSCDYRNLAKSDAPFGSLRVKFVQVISRHGDRTPLNLLHANDLDAWTKIADEPTFLKSSPIIDPVHPLSASLSAQKRPLGCLTKVGAEQVRTLGEYVRNRYVNEARFLPETMDPTILLARSSPLVRTQESAQSFFLGLYPPQSRPEGQTVTIESYMIPGEPILSSSVRCPRMFEILEKQKQTPEYVEREKAMADVIETVSKAIPHTRFSWLGYFEAIYCYKQHNVPLPETITDELVDRAISFIGWRVHHTRPKEYSVLRMETLMRHIVQDQQTAVANKNEFKLVHYSGHDTTIIPMLINYEVYDDVWPGYASSLIFELLEDEGGVHYVRLLRDGHPLVIPGCGGPLCNFEKFREITLGMIPSDIHQACQAKVPSARYVSRNH